MSREVWLRPNRRILGVGLIFFTLMLGVAVGLIAWSAHLAMTLAGLVLGALSLAMCGLILRSLMRPRLAYEDGFLLVLLGSWQPHRVPIELVECFFRGQGPSLLPAARLAGEQDSPESSTIVVRLAESAEDWKNVDVRPSLGFWCDGYITIRGTWCEPINAERMQQLNHRLVETHRQQRAAKAQETA